MGKVIRESRYKLKECCTVEEMTNTDINIYAIIKKDKTYGTIDTVYTVSEGTKLRLVKYFTDSRIFSFEVITDLSYEDREVRYFMDDTINLKENEFEWLEPNNCPINYFEPQLDK